MLLYCRVRFRTIDVNFSLTMHVEELLRYAIVRATEKDYEAVFQCYELVFELNVQVT